MFFAVIFYCLLILVQTYSALQSSPDVWDPVVATTRSSIVRNGKYLNLEKVQKNSGLVCNFLLLSNFLYFYNFSSVKFPIPMKAS